MAEGAAAAIDPVLFGNRLKQLYTHWKVGTARCS
jgi:hypothetical protein